MNSASRPTLKRSELSFCPAKRASNVFGTQSGRRSRRVSRGVDTPFLLLLSNDVTSDNQKILLEKALSVVERIPSAVTGGANNSDENAWKNCWNWNLTDAAYGQLILDIREGRVNAELKSQGFNYAYRRQA